tara:strand:+ start:951 stop:1154 length:204 start_codon:yes stop_codon:yes gene_type:complete
MIKGLKEIAELMRSNLYGLDEETLQELIDCGVISKEEEELLIDLENAIMLLENLKREYDNKLKQIKF